MTYRGEEPIDHAANTIDPTRRRVLVAAAAGIGTAMLGTLAWTRGVSAAASDGPARKRTVRIVAFDDQGRRVGERSMPTVVKTAEEWQTQLSPLAYRVTRENGTERAYSGDYTKPDVAGIYRCVCCDTALYDAATQFHSGTGWPSFWQPIAKQNVTEHVDHKLIVTRTAIACSRCDAHLGHVFNDGPEPTGLRYCMNSVALQFEATGSA